MANGNLPGARRLAQTVPYLSSSDSSLVSLDWAAEEGTEQARPCAHSKPSADLCPKPQGMVMSGLNPFLSGADHEVPFRACFTEQGRPCDVCPWQVTAPAVNLVKWPVFYTAKRGT